MRRQFRGMEMDLRSQLLAWQVVLTAEASDWTAIQQQGQAIAQTLAQTEGDRYLTYRLEIEKHLRLLQLDLSFWQRSRASQSQHVRVAALQQRQQTLIRYCEAVLTAIAQA
ncbi:heterocyst frequency control protein PatD [Synechococcus elongatus]|uniref:heterocyst frequency control protein PatD n=1 Tax=Synechococcus elongatus TaxID=32046 RepID=UPI000F7ED004|nr:heterocyst frequency control protein PatD [Synechococcus elongatus]